ncbi:MAG: 5-deoxy-glucuronate isomerase [Acidobacteria bacterium]|nr:5-deoxy-glucuronate isomerase [Acidobacteriota bacterium]
MRQYTAENLVVRPGGASDPNIIVEVTPAVAGWDTFSFQARRLSSGERWTFDTGPHELVLVVLGGMLDIASNRGAWAGVGGRAHVFAGLPHALYLPPRTAFTATATSPCEFAVAWVPAEERYGPRLVTPADVVVEIRGGDQATRHINRLIWPGFPCDRLVLVEVYTPGGNWSSYPPHKHDVHRAAADGTLLEADLDEIYYYKIDRPEGFAIQRVYTDATSPLQQAGLPIDATMTVRSDDVVIVPEGYHPVACPVGYTAYYLNVLAGSAQSLANVDDPDYAWVTATYRAADPRVPVYDVGRR